MVKYRERKKNTQSFCVSIYNIYTNTQKNIHDDGVSDDDARESASAKGGLYTVVIMISVFSADNFVE